ncbi:NADH-quinone oxidoreductase subunit NuoN [Antribacter sp. KLBMP9083]|uniref:NADH-quinone oxidoreductase subunit N n=1 Tax=Antribacter soli TaxID=2910976 RepID=A0AA41QA80_9MICO|nr:NADH-quinone oxidoreductase subunit NuoN [Antribacter soli]MCF4119366.1 NADH-quinone oxidoreductase subunit NuoN [Antribacter soli]
MTGFVVPLIDWAALAPLLVVLGAGVAGVLVEAFVPDAVRRAVQVVLTLVALAGALALVVLRWPVVVGTPETAGVSDVLVGGTVMVTPFALALQGTIAALAFLGVLVVADRTSTGQDAFAPTAAAVPGTSYEDLARRAGLQQTEIYPLLLFATGGMMLFVGTDDLLMLFVALEVLSLPLYVLCATARRRRLLSQEAAAKYFLLGAFASALFIFGVALIYGFAGTVRLDVLRQNIASGAAPLEGMTVLLVGGVLLVLVGLLFKLGAVPFHAWTPDVYTGAPTPVTGFMAACTKVAAAGAMVKVLYTVVVSVPADVANDLRVVVVTVAVATMVVGTVAGAVQTDVKRLLAYSSIAHAGFLLVAVAGYTGFSVRAVVFYLVAYGVATIGAFGVVTLVRETRLTGSADGSAEPAGADGEVADDGVVLGEATHLSQWAGLGRKAPWLTAAFALFLLSMAGIPLTAGFVAKFTAFSAAVSGDLTWLAVVGVLASVVAVFFYVRVIVLMVFTPAPDAEVTRRLSGEGAPGAAPASGTAVEVAGEGAETTGGGVATATRTEAARTVVTVVGSRGPAAVAVAICAAATILLGLLPGPVLELAGQAIKFVP